MEEKMDLHLYNKYFLIWHMLQRVKIIKVKRLEILRFIDTQFPVLV